MLFNKSWLIMGAMSAAMLMGCEQGDPPSHKVTHYSAHGEVLGEWFAVGRVWYFDGGAVSFTTDDGREIKVRGQVTVEQLP